MPWKEINGSEYYVRNFRQGGQVKSEYFGNGRGALIAEQVHRYLRALKQEQSDLRRRELEEFLSVEAESGLAGFLADVSEMVRALLVVAGYQQHNRGEWRRSRMTTELATVEKQARDEPMPPEHVKAYHSVGIRSIEDFDRLVPSDKEMRALFTSAAAGDSSEVEKLRMILVIDFDGTLARSYGVDSGAKIQSVLAWRAAGKRVGIKESLEVEADRIRADAAGPKPSVSERLLADRIALTWINLRRLELYGAEHEHEFNPREREAIERSTTRANRAHIEAIKALAIVRKLALPVIQMQMNIGDAGHQKMIAKTGTKAIDTQGEHL